MFFFDESLYLYPKGIQYLTKENTYKTFQSISFALEYFQYIVRATNDIRFEVYHYFLYKLQKNGIINGSWDFHYTNNHTMEDMMLRCDISDLSIQGQKVKYNFIVIFKKDGKCKLSFYPENPVWDEGKDCPETEIDKVIDYILNLKVDNYKDIPLKES